MDKALDLGFVFKSHETKHKSKPSQFVSVAGGVQKRRETNIKHRKSVRLTEFDNVRDLSASETPIKPNNEAELKIEHRRQQLEKWKEEKEMKRKQQAMQKKKPFVAGVVHAPLRFEPPPPIKPSSSGRVTRSQSARAQKAKNETKPFQSFAPKSSTTFKPPQLNCAVLPVFPSSKTRQKPSSKISVTFEPVVPMKTTVEPEKRTRSTRATRNNTNDKAKVKAKPSPKNNNTINKKTTTTTNKKTTQVMASIPEPSHISIIPAPEVNPVQEKPKRRASRKSSTQKFIIEDLQPQLTTRRTSTPILNNARVSQESIILPTRKTPKRSSVVEKNNNTPKNNSNKSIIRTPRNKSIPKSESTSEEKLRSPIDKPRTPEQIIEEAKKSSPCVTMSRGKDNARREMKKKLHEGLLDEDSSDQGSVEHFRRQMEAEVRRMTLLADEWDGIQQQTALPEFVVELILTAVGQARLLMSQKIRQFAGLVARCAARDAAAGLVTPADLAGFWDMLFIQIENIDVRFQQLQRLRARAWREEPRAAAAGRRRTAKASAAARPAAQSRIKDMIAAARKAKKDQETTSALSSSSPISISSTQTSDSTNSNISEQEKPSPESKTFEAGFFCVKSPISSPLPRTPVRKQSLLKCVLSSEARKASSHKNSPASFAMLRASLKGKNVEIEGISPLEQTPKQLPAINLDATPARSILKSAQKKKPAKKSIKTVLFDHSDNESPAKSPKDLLDTTPIKDKEAADSGVSMDLDSENKENKRRITRQDAVDYSPVMTRLRRKSIQTSVGDKTEKVLKEVANTPKRSSRRKSVGDDLIDLNTPKEQPRRARRARRADV